MSKHVYMASNTFSLSPCGWVFHLSQWVSPLTVTKLEYQLKIKYVLISIGNLLYYQVSVWETSQREIQGVIPEKYDSWIS